ncbi:MAG: DUF6748 domain-containing protein [Kofleriaceae bacterium]
MRTLLIAALPLVSLSLISACSSDVVDELAGETADDLASDGKADGAVDGVHTYFKVASDARKCAAPFCGGFQLERLNRTTTDCHDGSTAARCYTPELDWSEAKLSQAQQDEILVGASRGQFESGAYALVRGRFAPRSSGTTEPQLGRFIVTEAWIADTEAVADGVFVKVRDSGRRCIQAPCESMVEKGLNGSRQAYIAGIDYTDAGLSDAQLETVGNEVFEPHGLIIAGDRYTVSENGLSARGRTATAVYRRLTSADPNGVCFVGGCAGTVCSDKEGVVTTCEWRDEYACYAEATCARSATGTCGWAPTAELEACLAD